EYGTTAKFLELLKELNPEITSIGVLRDSGLSAGIEQLASIQKAASSLGLEVEPCDVQSREDIEENISRFAWTTGGGLIVTDSALTLVHLDVIILLAASYQLPAVYPARVYVSAGGLMSYGVNRVEQFREAAAYVDRILRGAPATDLPVQMPTKYELVI